MIEKQKMKQTIILKTTHTQDNCPYGVEKFNSYCPECGKLLKVGE